MKAASGSHHRCSPAYLHRQESLPHDLPSEKKLISESVRHRLLNLGRPHEGQNEYKRAALSTFFPFSLTTASLLLSIPKCLHLQETLAYLPQKSSNPKSVIHLRSTPRSSQHHAPLSEPFSTFHRMLCNCDRNTAGLPRYPSR